MALEDHKATSDAGVVAADRTAQGATPDRAPLYVSLAFLGGLGVAYLGQRVVAAPPALTRALILGGAGLSLGATALRLVHTLRSPGKLLSVSGTLLVLQGLGLFSVGAHWATHDLPSTTVGWQLGPPVLWLVLLLTSTVGIVFAEIALGPMRSAAHLEPRRVQGAATSGITMALALVYCSLLVYSAAQVGRQADFSYFRVSEPSKATRAVLETLSEPVSFFAFFPQVNEVGEQVRRYLDALADGDGHVTVQYVDRFLEPKLAEQLRVSRDGVIAIAKGEATEQVIVGDDLAAARSKLRKLDEEIAGRLVKLLRSTRTAYLTVGHGEYAEPRGADVDGVGRASRGVRAFLEQQNYRVKDLGLGQGLGTTVPADAGLVVVLGPTSPFAPEELAALAEYWKRGGKILMALDAEGWPAALGAAVPHEADSLKGLLGIVGLGYEAVALADDRQFIPRRRNSSDHQNLFSNRFSSHASVSTLSRNSQRATVVFAGAGALALLPESTLRGDSVVRSLATTFADENGNFLPDEDEPVRSFALAMAVADAPPKASDGASDSTPDSTADAPPDATLERRAFVVADADALSDELLGTFAANRMLALDAIRWLGGEESLAGELESEEDVRILHTQDQDRVWFYSLIFGVPSLVLGCGWLLRRVVLPRRERL